MQSMDCARWFPPCVCTLPRRMLPLCPIWAMRARSTRCCAPCMAWTHQSRLVSMARCQMGAFP